MSLPSLITFNGHEYKSEIRNGAIKLSRFNHKFDLWIELNFSTHESVVEDELIKLISDEYVRQVLSKTQLNSPQ